MILCQLLSQCLSPSPSTIFSTFFSKTRSTCLQFLSPFHFSLFNIGIHTYEQATQLFSPFHFSLSNTGIHIEEQVTQFFKKWICVHAVLFCMILFTIVKESMHMAVLLLMDNGLKKNNHWCSRPPSWGVAGRNLRAEGQRSLARAVATQCTGEGFYFTSDRRKPNVYWGPNPDSVCEADILPLDHLLLMDNG